MMLNTVCAICDRISSPRLWVKKTAWKKRSCCGKKLGWHNNEKLGANRRKKLYGRRIDARDNDSRDIVYAPPAVCRAENGPGHLHYPGDQHFDHIWRPNRFEPIQVWLLKKTDNLVCYRILGALFVKIRHEREVRECAVLFRADPFWRWKPELVTTGIINVVYLALDWFPGITKFVIAFLRLGI